MDSYFGYTKILWLKHKEPQQWRRIRLLLPPNAYINYRLTGEVAIDHSSAGNRGGMYDIRAHVWSEELAQALGIPVELLLKRIVPWGEVVGEVSQDGAELIGLAPGTLVLAGGWLPPWPPWPQGLWTREQR